MSDDPHPDLVKRTIAVSFAEKRLDRARQRELDAMREKRLAMAALEIEQARLAAWKIANPAPQMELL